MPSLGSLDDSLPELTNQVECREVMYLATEPIRNEKYHPVQQKDKETKRLKVYIKDKESLLR